MILTRNITKTFIFYPIALLIQKFLVNFGDTVVRQN